MSEIFEYISSNLEKTVRKNTNDTPDGLIGLPYPYTVPSVAETNFFQEMYYWDTYFTCKGLHIMEKWELAKNNTDDMLYAVDKFGYMPNGTRKSLFGRSQPPVLSLMVADVYRRFGDRVWLSGAYGALKKEYAFWSEKRITPIGLNRYGGETGDMNFYEKIFTERVGISPDLSDSDSLARHCLALCESGWDMNPRMEFECYNYVSPDLNSLLYMMEKNMEDFAEILDNGEAKIWKSRADRRRELMNRYLVNGENLFYDYNFEKNTLGKVFSVASLYPLFARLASEEQAEAAVKSLGRLEFEYGISACEKHDTDGRYQWHYPNGWAPLHYIAVIGLDNYGYTEDALRIAKKYVCLTEKVFGETGNLWEKYNVVNGSTDVIDGNDGCSMPAMIGWTAGTYLSLKKYIESKGSSI